MKSSNHPHFKEGGPVEDLVVRLQEAVANKGLSIGEAWNLIDESIERIFALQDAVNDAEKLANDRGNLISRLRPLTMSVEEAFRRYDSSDDAIDDSFEHLRED